jgi:O-antigen/teichoic acid export membrane protein
LGLQVRHRSRYAGSRKIDVARLSFKWITRGGSRWAIADQIFVSGGNFATTLVFSRWLPPAEFGTFALINSVCLVANGFHSNLIICPLMVFGGSEAGKERRGYPAAALTLSSLLFPFWLMAILVAALYLHRGTVGLLAVLSVFAWQSQETTRRALFAVYRHRAAIWGDLISYPGQAALILLLMIKMRPTLSGAFAVMASTSLAAAWLQSRQVNAAAVSWQECVRVGGEFWQMGKWLLLSSAAGIAAAPLLPWLLNWARGRTAAAEFQAVMSVLNLTNPLVLSITAIVIPAVAGTLPSGDRLRDAGSIALRYVTQFELILVPFMLVILIWPRWVLTVFYGAGSPYAGQMLTLRIGALACALSIPLSVLQSVFAGKGKTRNNAILQTGGSLPALLGAPLFVWLAGVPGAMAAETINRGVKVTLGWHLLTRSRIHESAIVIPDVLVPSYDAETDKDLRSEYLLRS